MGGLPSLRVNPDLVHVDPRDVGEHLSLNRGFFSFRLRLLFHHPLSFRRDQQLRFFCFHLTKPSQKQCRREEKRRRHVSFTRERRLAESGPDGSLDKSLLYVANHQHVNIYASYNEQGQGYS